MAEQASSRRGSNTTNGRTWNMSWKISPSNGVEAPSNRVKAYSNERSKTSTFTFSNEDYQEQMQKPSNIDEPVKESMNYGRANNNVLVISSDKATGQTNSKPPMKEGAKDSLVAQQRLRRHRRLEVRWSTLDILVGVNIVVESDALAIVECLLKRLSPPHWDLTTIIDDIHLLAPRPRHGTPATMESKPTHTDGVKEALPSALRILSSSHTSLSSLMMRRKYRIISPLEITSTELADDLGHSLGSEALHIALGAFKPSRSQGLVLDTGTTLNILNSTGFDPVVSAVQKKMRLKKIPDPHEQLELCYEGTMEDLDEFLPLTFHFTDGADLVLEPNSYFQEVAEQVLCLAMVRNDGGVSIIGNLAMQNYNIGYDLMEKKISFGREECWFF
ncbi:hypothetical protein HHK36_022889 [Tetracentron sinense]|uniref:Xylanase inhibitor C-terminal domain-containing protein n=1 Tax=Tetracentron sinense TaxID=13715 RepID=A0A834YNM2_TETSI|nr:hypothetical protein HHK36_022889 [Tetracentron sinense]